MRASWGRRLAMLLGLHGTDVRQVVLVAHHGGVGHGRLVEGPLHQEEPVLRGHRLDLRRAIEPYKHIYRFYNTIHS